MAITPDDVPEVANSAGAGRASAWHLVNLMTWFALGCALAVLFQAAAVRVHGAGRWASLLHVGTSLPFYNAIERELGPLASNDAVGHDAQQFYVIARDPFAKGDAPRLILESQNSPQYRYRRILYPFLAGGSGTFSPRATLIAMIALACTGAGLATAATADLCSLWKLERTTILLALANPGMILSVSLLLSDSMALGLSLVGLSLACRRWIKSSWLLFSLAVLTKETYFLFPLSLAALFWLERRRALTLATIAVPLLPVLLWSLWIWSHVPPGRSAATNFSWPGNGVITSVRLFAENSPLVTAADIGMIIVGLILIVMGVVLAGSSKNRILLSGTIAWAALGTLLSLEVWSKANNALRVLAPLWVYVALSYGIVRSRRVKRAVALRRKVTVDDPDVTVQNQ